MHMKYTHSIEILFTERMTLYSILGINGNHYYEFYEIDMKNTVRKFVICF